MMCPNACIILSEPPRPAGHSHKYEEGLGGPAEGEELPYFSASSSNMNMKIVPGAVTFQNIDEMTKVGVDWLILASAKIYF